MVALAPAKPMPDTSEDLPMPIRMLSDDLRRLQQHDLRRHGVQAAQRRFRQIQTRALDATGLLN